MNPVLPSLLLVLGNPIEPTPADTAVRAMLTGWGYSVSVADDDAAFDWEGVDVAYIALSASGASLGDRLTLAPVGIVAELGGVLGLPEPSGGFTGTSIVISPLVVGSEAPGHWLTQPWPLGPLTITTTLQPMISTGFGPGTALAHRLGQPGALVLQVLDVGEAPARRVQLPFGGAGFDHGSLNTDGRELMRRSVKWALHFKMVGRIGVLD